jgi:hypothetical protein
MWRAGHIGGVRLFMSGIFPQTLPPASQALRFYPSAMLQPVTLAYMASLATATLMITDPSDTINPVDWEADNALLADYNIPPTLYQTEAIVGPYGYNATALNISHTVLTASANDTSVVVIANGSDVKVSYTDVVKSGYCSNLYQASFFGKVPSSQSKGG